MAGIPLEFEAFPVTLLTENITVSSPFLPFRLPIPVLNKPPTSTHTTTHPPPPSHANQPAPLQHAQ